jgi:carboxyl-terminal processing protease
MNRTEPVRRLGLAAVMGAFVSACGRTTTAPRIDDAPRVLVETVWRDYDRWYAFFPARDLDWAAIGDAYLDSADHVVPDQPTAALIGRMIARLDDGHADLATPFGEFGAAPSGHDKHFDWELVRDYFAEPARQTQSARIRYGMLEHGVGYVLLNSFAGSAWRAEIDEAFLALSAASAFIIDIRPNGGGSEDFARDVASRFYDVERVYRTARFRTGPAHTDLGPPVSFTLGPAQSGRLLVEVAVVTGRQTASAAEDFVLMMRVLPHAFTIGDTTAGVGSYPMVRALPNGWRYRIPQSQQATPDGFVYNRRGLPPAIPVSWDESVLAGRRDPYIEAALTALARGSQGR